MRYLLDTNIISDIAKPAPSESLLAWMSEQNDDDLFIASLTVAEIRRGVLEKPAGWRMAKRRADRAARSTRSSLRWPRLTAALWSPIMKRISPTSRSSIHCAEQCDDQHSRRRHAVS